MIKKPVIKDNSIIIPSIPEMIIAVDEYIETRLRDAGVSESIIADIAICATELANNGIYHGNKEDRNKVVTVLLEIDKKKIQVTVSDEGDIFNPDKLANPTDDEFLLREAGRGVFIVKKLMDTTVYSRSENGGTVVTITKKLD